MITLNRKNLVSLGWATLSLALALGLGACSKPQETKPDEAPTSDQTTNADESSMGDSDSGKAMGLKTINFPYDSYELTPSAKATLAANAKIMKENGSLKIQIEGHCDARGGIQYNLALGEKRANSVRSYLSGQGIAGERVTTISFGKEKLINQAMTEEAHSQNRRANFVVTSR